ncbi:MAG: hypothetical protein HPY50_00320 [Firmicutes bacterium]|nr:hypothetical protein [Bacillota bacterium]
MRRVRLPENAAVRQREGDSRGTVPKNRRGGKAAALEFSLRRVLYLLLACLLAAAYVAAAPTNAHAAGEVCEIVGGLQYATLDEALAAVADGQTIRLLEDIDYDGGVTINGISITFDLDGHTLNVTNPAAGQAGLGVTDGAVSLTGLDGPAAFNVTGDGYGVWVTGAASSAAVTSAAASGAGGVGARAEDGGDIEIAGSAQGVSCGVFANGAGSSVVVGGNATASGDDGFGAYARAGGSVTVTGDAVAGGANGIGAEAESGGSIEITGAAQGVLAGASASEAGSSVTVGGDASASGADGFGAYARIDGSVIVNGNAVTSGAGGIGAEAESGGSIEITGDAHGVLAGAYASEADSSVTVGGDASASGADGFGAYARIDGSVVVTGNAVAGGAGGIGAEAESGGSIEVAGDVQGIMAGAYARDDDSSITVGGNAAASGAGSFGADALNGGHIEVAGDTQGVSYGAFTNGPDSSVTVGGNTVASGAAGVGAGAENGGSMAVTSDAEGESFGVYAADADSIITVGGNASASGVAGIGAYASSGAGVVITGDAEGASAGASASGPDSSVTVGGNAASESNYGANAFDSGEITIDGVITAPVYLRVGIDNKGIDDYEAVTTKPGYRTYTDGDSTVWVREDTAAPSIPANLRVTGRTSSGISLAWDASTDNIGVDHYVVEMRPEGGLWAATGAPAVASFDQIGLDPHTTYLFRVNAVDGAGNESAWSDELSARTRSSGGGGGGGTAALLIGTANPPDGTVGAAYAHSFTASGGRPPYTFEVTEGGLPLGLSLAQNGALSGTPAAAGTSRYTVTVTDSSGRTSGHGFTHIIAAAADLPKTITLTIGSTAATVDGQPYTLDATPYIDADAGRTMVPVRFISEVLGAEVEWRAVTRQVVIKDGNIEIVLTIDSTLVRVNGTEQGMDCAPAILPPGRTFVPLRFVSEVLGAAVDYDSDDRRITITR